MNIQGVYQQPGPTTVVIVQEQQPNRYWRWNTGNTYPTQAIRVCGIPLTLPILIGLTVFGSFLIFCGIMAASFGSNDPAFWQEIGYKISPPTIVGSIMIFIGGIVVIAAVSLGCYSKQKYKQTGISLSGENPGRVINRNPGMNPDCAVPLNAMASSGPSGIGFSQNRGRSHSPSRGELSSGFPFTRSVAKDPPHVDNPPSYLDSTLQVPYHRLGKPEEQVMPNAIECDVPPPYNPDYKPPGNY